MSQNSSSPYRQPLSSSSSRQSLRKEVLSRPETASRGDRQSRGLPEDRPSIDETLPQEIVTSPSHDGAINSTEEHEPQAQHPSNSTFQPFFTLVEDAHTSDYYHPNVHYIFSDDDADIVTEAALRSLTAQQDALSESKKDQIAQSHVSNPLDTKDPEDPESDPAKTTLLPPPVLGVRENYLILDMEPVPATNDAAQNPANQPKGGTKSMSSSPANPSIPPLEGQPGASKHPQFRVTSAQSFSSSWQVLDTEVMPAPTFENTPESPGQGLMLQIRGTGGMPVEVSGKEKGARRLEEMMDQFAKRMSELQTIIDAAEAKTQRGEEEEPLEQDPPENTGQEVTLEGEAALHFD